MTDEQELPLIHEGNAIPPADPEKMDPRYRVSGKQWKTVGGRATIVNNKGEIFQWDYKKGGWKFIEVITIKAATIHIIEKG